VGSIELIHDTIQSLLHKKFALDYIAILAITTGVLTHEYLVAAVIVLMLAGGNTLEKYGVRKAKSALTKLTDRIPHTVLLTQSSEVVSIASVAIGQEITVRQGEVIPLDGTLVSTEAIVDESSLTGEAFPQQKHQGQLLRSGTVNVSAPLILSVTKVDKDSTYRKIIQMVSDAQSEKSPLIRIADRYSVIFTIVTFVICALAYLLTGSLERVLAVLVLATPCPLILATPIALMGGVNAAASMRIIIKRLSSLEVLARVRAILFDKTGTLTLGKPSVKTIDRVDEHIALNDVLAIAAAGVSGVVDGHHYKLHRFDGEEMSIALWRAEDVLAKFLFEDQIKSDAVTILTKFQEQGMKLALYTGDESTRTQNLLAKLHLQFEVHAHCTPEDKQKGIREFQRQGIVTAMVGDGINDAPALASADVGMVFSNEEQTASSEAADIVFLSGTLESVSDAIGIADHTLRIAKESIFVGIGLSIIGMLLAALGYIPPISGAIAQEAIDVCVILNALRATSWKRT
jgi:heavy metal-(Cd/Co/Hg/Pb/Zn)-translocating P-type ATPase